MPGAFSPAPSVFPGVCYAFLDSGIGGLPYLRQLKTLAPGSPCVYVADTARFPYGEKPPGEIIASAVEVTKHIVERFRPEVIVVACNTISVSALDVLRERFPVAFVGTVPAIKKAAEISRNRRIGLLATERTVSHGYTQKLVEEFAGDCEIVRVAASSLIADIEDRLVTATDEEKVAAVRPFLSPFMDAGTDTVVLACTHFLHIGDVFKKTLGPDVTVVDSLDGVAHQALRVFLRRMGNAAHGVDSRASTSVAPDPPATPRTAGQRRDTLFVTGTLSAAREERYRIYCGLYGLAWGGVL